MQQLNAVNKKLNKYNNDIDKIKKSLDKTIKKYLKNYKLEKAQYVKIHSALIICCYTKNLPFPNI